MSPQKRKSLKTSTKTNPHSILKGNKNEARTSIADESFLERFKQTIQWLMADRRISEAELSRLTDLSPATIHRLIYGITDPRLSTLRAIAAFFNIRIEQLIGEYPIPSITQISNENSDKIFFSTPILIPFIEWDHLTQYIDNVGDFTMSNWATWHATTNETKHDSSFDYFATKLNYTAGNLLHAESILIIRSINKPQAIKIGDCVIGSNDKSTIFIGQISGSGDEIAIKGGNALSMSKSRLYGIAIKCESPLEKISRYTIFI